MKSLATVQPHAASRETYRGIERAFDSPPGFIWTR